MASKSSSQDKRDRSSKPAAKGAAGPPSASQQQRSAAPRSQAAASSTGAVSGGWWAFCLLLLLLAATAAGMLSLEHLGGLALPGCGKGSPCAEAANSVWGKLPVIGWPVSYLGFAYFLGLIAAWLGARNGLTPAFVNLVRVGGLVSILYLGVIFANASKYLCYYCMATHAANLIFWALVELRGRLTLPSLKPVVVVASVFALSTAGLATAEFRQKEQVRQKGESDQGESTRKIIAASTRPTDGGDSLPVTPLSTTQATPATKPAATAPTQPPPVAVTQPKPPEPGPSPATKPAGFTGRYRHGPERAKVRLVILSDYQCPDCLRIEGEVRQLLVKHPDEISFSAKHFPMSPDCNPTAPNLHPNACWAARAAEAAGILGGADAFLRMHHWLFDRKGSFTDAEIKEALPGLGFDTAQFIQVMSGAETAARVKADVEEGVALGLYFTPMIFVNGVELRGWHIPNAVTKTVEAVLAENPPPQTYEVDNPPMSSEKYVGDWREAPKQVNPPDNRAWPRGPADAKISILVFGDYQSNFTAELNREVMRLIGNRKDVQYIYRHYPFNKDCNPSVPNTINPLACRMAAAAEAAGTLGGLEGYWRMHEWLLTSQKTFSEALLKSTAPQLGFDADALLKAMDAPEIKAAISEDVTAGQRLALRGVPSIWINGKVIPRWKRDNDNILDRIFAEAAGEPIPKPPSAGK